MEDRSIKSNFSIGKIIAIVLMVGLLIWQGMLSYFVYGVSRLFTDMETSNIMIVFITGTQPFIWIFMLLTVLAIYDVFARSKFLILNTFTLLSVVAVANVFLQILVVLAGYAPIFDLSKAPND